MATPFELRLELIKIATDMLDREFQIKERLMETAIDSADDDEKLQAAIDNKPRMYTTNQVIKKAESLYTFVNKRE